MSHLDMNKLLDKETLERGRVVVTMESRNLQIGEVIDAIAQTEPELFGKGAATLMPVNHVDKLYIPICDSHLNNLTTHDHDH
jgi:hypothetical protein